MIDWLIHSWLSVTVVLPEEEVKPAEAKKPGSPQIENSSPSLSPILVAPPVNHNIMPYLQLPPPMVQSPPISQTDPIEPRSPAPSPKRSETELSPISSCSPVKSKNADVKNEPASKEEEDNKDDVASEGVSEGVSGAASETVNETEAEVEAEVEAEEKEKASLVKELNAFVEHVYGYVKHKSPSEQQLFALAFANMVNSKNGRKGNRPFSFTEHLGLQYY